MFERFTEPARHVVVLAQEEARALKHNYIGTEHLLLGLLREWDGLAARVLDSLGVTIQEVRAQVASIVGQGDNVTTGQIPFTPRGKKILEHALKEARELGHNYIGTEHLLLGLARENQGVAARVLLGLGADAQGIRGEVMRLLAAEPPPEETLDGDDLLGELRAITQAKEAAIEAREFERAAKLRDKERRLLGRLRVGHELPIVAQEIRLGGKPPLIVRLDEAIPLALGWLLFAVALGIGILIGWLIWG